MRSDSRGRLHRTLAEAVRRLDRAGIRYMVVGGLAVSARSAARMTRDVDLTVDLEPSAAPRLLEVLGPGFRPLPAAPPDFAADHGVLPVEGPDGTQLDLIFACTGFERAAVARATEIRIGTVRARVCTTEDLILHKLLAGRERDLEDIRALVRAAGRALDRRGLGRSIGALAAAADRPELLVFFRSLFRRRGPAK